MTTRWYSIRVVITTVLLFCSFTTGFALGATSHTVNSINHGCDDFGCTGGANQAGDYVKQGFNSSSTYIGDTWVSIHDTRNSNAQKAYSWCGACYVITVSYDTNPTFECKFSTYHIVKTRLDPHYHYTESYPC